MLTINKFNLSKINGFKKNTILIKTKNCKQKKSYMHKKMLKHLTRI